jgi:hypothetical protein
MEVEMANAMKSIADIEREYDERQEALAELEGPSQAEREAIRNKRARTTVHLVEMEGWTLDQALDLAPGWKHFFLNRFEHGWTYVSAMGRRYVMDETADGGPAESGWIPLDNGMEIYHRLGERQVELYIEIED